jgi:phosphate transport system protein
MSRDSRHAADDLAELSDRLLTMAGLAEERLRLALRGLVERDEAVLAAVIAGDSSINNLQMEIDDRCFKHIALFQPVAVDLRTVVSTLKINADLERIGDLAVNVAELAQRYSQHRPVKPLIDLPRMADLAMRMLRDAIEAFIKRDVNAAQKVLRDDDWLDGLKEQIFRELLTFMLGSPQTIEPAIDLILISRHLERIGDHATNIAEDVIFVVDGRDVRHRVTLNAPVERRRPLQTPPV